MSDTHPDPFIRDRWRAQGGLSSHAGLLELKAGDLAAMSPARRRSVTARAKALVNRRPCGVPS